MQYKLEVVTLAVADVDRAKDFYTRQAGFTLDVDYHPAGRFRVVQVTPPGSGCSVQFGVGLTGASPGAAKATYLVVSDVEAARAELTGRGVTVRECWHKVPVDNWKGGVQPGLDPERRDYASFTGFTDPDGNGWVLQEIGYRG